jgi:hypothetical protein
MIEIIVPLGPIAQLKVSGSTSHEVLGQLADVERSEIPLTLGRVLDGIGVQERMGRLLGAEQVDETTTQQPQAPASGPSSTQADSESTTHAGGAQIAAEPVPDWAQIVPGAPVVLGQPAWFTRDHSIGKQVFIHPSSSADWTKPQTADENDPRLAAGEAVFYRVVG